MSSLIWRLFQIDETNPALAICNICAKKIKRGSEKSGPKSYSTKPLHNHAKKLHSDEYNDSMLKNKDSSTSQPRASTSMTPKEKKLEAMGKQLTLQESFTSRKIWDINDSRSGTIHKKIGLMMALDNHPFSLVEQDGFIGLMAYMQPRYLLPNRTYFSEKVIPEIYEGLKGIVMKKMEEGKYISFTSDIWTCQFSNESFISLSGHWILNDYTLCNAVLHSAPFSGKHTALNISEKLLSMLQSWEIKQNRRNILVRDGASNISLGCDLIEMPSVHCSIHLMQLVVNDALNSQRSIKDLLAKCRRLATHFNHSQAATSEFKALQREQGLDPLVLIQDVCTRWNSSYLMLERIDRLKKTVQLYLADHSDLLLISSNEWHLTGKLLKLLKPFYQLTQDMSSESSLLSTVIPNMCTLERYLSKIGQDDEGVQTTKEELLKSLRSRFFAKESNEKKKCLNILKNRYYTLSTAIDPRFKFIFFKDEQKENIKTWIIEEIIKINKDMESSVNPWLKELSDDSSHSTDSSSSTSSCSSTKKRKIDEDPFSLCFTEITKEFKENAGVHKEHLKNKCKTATIAEIANEIEKYINKPISDRKLSPLEIWKEEESFPLLKALVPKLLVTPASSVFSERMFSEQSNIFEDKRSNLLPKRGEMILFIHHNARKFETSLK